MKEDDANWPAPDRVGRQELEIVMGNEHISFATTKLGSLLQVGGGVADQRVVLLRRRPLQEGRQPGGAAEARRLRQGSERQRWQMSARPSQLAIDRPPCLPAPLCVWCLPAAGAKQQGSRGAARVLLPGAGANWLQF